MVKVLVIGAAGYIGLRVVQQLRRANHIVYGTTRTSSKENTLLVNEVIPIVGPLESEHQQTPPWIDAVRDENIEVVVDLSGTQDGAKVILEPLIHLSKERQSARLPKIGFIYCSGIWVHGSDVSPTSDLTGVGIETSARKTPPLVAWRPEHERQVLASYEHLNAAVIRPSLVYGGSGDIWDLYFAQIYHDIKNKASTISLKADPNAAISLVHVDDAASAFVAVVEKLELVAGQKDQYPVFDVASSHESLAFVLRRFAEELGHQGKVEFTGVPEGSSFPELFIQAFNTNINSGSTRAKTLLGWSPTKTGFAAGISIYAKAWEGSFLERNKTK
ncbi:hypothetical protein BGZ80_001115 [Entomortierella chlamydospora]|uniref:NAD-dependent epimerase/dehydratase domain-containing protein n=1 Tax=Entomortierella chlamydospora TaxID=101097 RepID=A0A9P6N3E6_9FUNG|nr:hypothetical protein BGZ79_009386 [Entomortierella chlamydospora]KAG0022075.1 hypothetical protein BGZ80_001115 [Entomortierella chlamydospora]